nr:neuronal pentraxin-1 [Vicugna pacos]
MAGEAKHIPKSGGEGRHRRKQKLAEVVLCRAPRIPAPSSGASLTLPSGAREEDQMERRRHSARGLKSIEGNTWRRETGSNQDKEERGLRRAPGSLAQGGARRQAGRRLLTYGPGRCRPQLAGMDGTNSLKDLLQSKIDDLERQVLSRVNTLEEGKGGSKNDTEERVKIENALTSLHQRISELEKGQKDSRPGDKFQLTFPLRTNYMYAKVKKSLPEMYAFTVCMWLKSSAAPGVGTPFSYAVPGQANELVLIEWGNNPMEILINDKVAKLPFVINDGKWHHICITWTTRDGVWEAYQDGTQGGNGENLAPYHPIKPQGVLVLGQEQDTLGGGFDATQAFVGELAHFNIWDRKLTPGEVYNLATCSTKALSGNVIAWAESHIEIYGGATKWTFEACRQIN